MSRIRADVVVNKNADGAFEASEGMKEIDTRSIYVRFKTDIDFYGKTVYAGAKGVYAGTKALIANPKVLINLANPLRKPLVSKLVFILG